MFDLTERCSIESMGNWVEEIRSKADAGVKVLIVGNKRDRERAISPEEIKERIE